MARPQTDDIQRDHHPNNSSKTTETSPTFQQLLQREGSKWSKVSVQKQKKHHDHEDEGNHHHKKSVLAKVKEKAKKFRNSLSGKKRRDENDAPCTSVARLSGASLEDKGEEDVEYHSARMSPSKHTPDANKQASRDHPREAPTSIPENNSMTTNVVNPSTDESESSGNMIMVAESNKHTSADTNAKNHALARADVLARDLQESGSRFSRLTVSTSESGTSQAERSMDEGNIKGESQTWDKGVSVKEYLMHKFEPGEDERALSQVITQTISPRRDKMREAMSSFLKNEEPSDSTSKLSNSEVNSSAVVNDPSPDLKSKKLPESANLDTNTESGVAPTDPSHNSESSSSKSSLKLNETFKSTMASYQNHNPGSNPNHNPSLNNSSATSSSPNTKPESNKPMTHLPCPSKTSSSPSGQSSSGNETRSPTQTNTDATQVPGHTNTNVRRAPVSSANQTQIPSHTETNTIRVPLSTANQTQVHGQTDANVTRSTVSTGNESRSPVNNNGDTTRVPASTNNNGGV